MPKEIICPHCRNPIYDHDALLCHFCGESLDRASDGFLGQLRAAHQKVIWIFVIFFVLVAFLVWTSL